MPTVPYLTLAKFKTLTVMPGSFVDAIEITDPGWVDTQLLYWSAWLDSRLRKRYLAPFVLPYPLAVEGWLSRLVTVRCYLKRGVDPTDEQYADVKADDVDARKEITEAAESVTGLFDLPVRADLDASGISQGNPRSYSEQSPYSWTTVQGEAGRAEDRNGNGGTFR
jgi:hypothetical protein